MDGLEDHDRYKVTTHTEVGTMKKLDLSIIRLGLCLILGAGSLAAQGRGRGGNKKSQTTFLVELVLGENGDEVFTICPGEAKGSTLEAFFPLHDNPLCLVVTGEIDRVGTELFLFQISSGFTKKKLLIHMFFRRVGGDEVYQTGDLPAFPVSGDPLSGESFRIGVDRTVILTKVGQPNKGSEAFLIKVGHVKYFKVEE